MNKPQVVRFKGFYEKGKYKHAMNSVIEKIHLKKVDFNKWYCYLVLKPFKEVSTKVLVMRMSKRVQLLFRHGFTLTIDVVSYSVENSTITIEGYINRRFTSWKNVIFDVVRADKSKSDGDDGDLNECAEEKND